ncbi:MAG: DUF86 domain-containing protein [Candidatus Pacebacteria bacterium]|nr:DUF86 domain-containing protein [Candidatus Paceibacterota bacterium]
MPPSNLDDQDRIAHILAECQFLQSLLPQLTVEQLQSDGIHFRAVSYSFVIMGEASHHLSSDFKNSISEIHWKQIYGMRNLLVHRYDDVNIQTLWDSLEFDVPKLQKLLTTKFD